MSASDPRCKVFELQGGTASWIVAAFCLTIAPLLFASGAFCAETDGKFTDARPPDAELILTTRYGVGVLGGGAWANMYITDLTFEDVVARYRRISRMLEGSEEESGVDGFRFDADGECITIRPWLVSRDSRRFSGALSPEELERLAQASAYIESHPDDCEYHG